MKNIKEFLKSIGFKKDKPKHGTYMFLKVRGLVIIYDYETELFQLNDIILNIKKKSQLVNLIKVLQ